MLRSNVVIPRGSDDKIQGTGNTSDTPVASLPNGGISDTDGDLDAGAPERPPPPIFPPNILALLRMVLHGFDGEHEYRFKQFMIQRNLDSTSRVLSLRCILVSIKFAKLLWAREFLLSLLFFLLISMPVYLCRSLCRVEWANHLGWATLWMINSRAAALSAPIFGLGDLHSTANMQFMLMAIVLPFFERIPIRVIGTVHHVFWLVIYLRNDYVEEKHQQSVKMVLAGYIACTAARVGTDIHERWAHIR